MYKEQNENYKVIDLRYQYTEVLGRFRYAIVSDETEEYKGKEDSVDDHRCRSVRCDHYSTG